jgi:hypothetical protein
MMNFQLLETAAGYKPDVILLGHCDLVKEGTLEEIKKLNKSTRIAQFNVDATFRLKTMHNFSLRSKVVDMSFITTADKFALRDLKPKPLNVRYFPNPVDGSIETGRIFEHSRQDLQLDLMFLGTGIGTREHQVDYLDANLPECIRRHFSGGLRSTPRLSGVEFLQALQLRQNCLAARPRNPCAFVSKRRNG